MADYPTVYPDSISIESGAMITDRLTTASGVTSVVRRTKGFKDVSFSLTYTNLTSTSVNSIRTHFQDHFDFNQSFSVPLAVLGSFAIVSSDAKYYYDSELEETQRGIYTDLTVTLKAIDDNTAQIILNPGDSSTQSETAVPKSTSDLSTYVFSGTAPFVLDAGSAVASSSIAVILEGGDAYP